MDGRPAGKDGPNSERLRMALLRGEPDRVPIQDSVKAIVQLGHDQGLPFIYHCDGNVMEVLDDFVAVGIDALHPIEPKAVELAVLRLLRDVAPGGGYCLGSGHSVQDYVPIENYRAMIETVFRHGHYPIDVPDSLIEAAEPRVAASGHRRREPRELPQDERAGFEDQALVT